MVVISVALTTRLGKAIVARQFVELSKSRVENLLTAFPKLIGASLQHTYVENESVRFLFQPMETIYLVLLTTKQSNVVEDLDTLRLLAKIVTDACPTPTEESISEAAFDLVAAFDEVISLGYRESITLQGVRANLEMNSHEEKLSQMIRQSKESEAKQEMKRQAANIKAAKAAAAARPGGSSTGFGPGSAGYQPPYQPAAAPQPMVAAAAPKQEAPKVPKPGEKKGLQLGKKKRGDEALEAMAAEDGLDAEAIKDTSASKLTGAAAAPGAVAVPKEPVHITVSETVSAAIKQDGSFGSFSCNGEVQITCRLDDTKCAIVFARDDALAANFQFKTHPQIDKALWEKSAVLGLKQRDRAFATNAPFGALKYHAKPISSVDKLPLSVAVWPQQQGPKINVNVEFELHGDFELLNVVIIVPLGSGDMPEVVAVDAGSTRHNSRRQQLEWVIEEISPDKASGSLEFNLVGNDTLAFFPTTVAFNAQESLAGLAITGVTLPGSNEPVRYGAEIKLVSDVYTVGEE